MPPLTKSEFAKYLNDLRDLYDFEKKLYDILDHTVSIWEKTGDVECSVSSLLSKLMEPRDDDWSDIDYFCWELDFGRNWKPGMIKDEDGKDVRMSTPEELYDFLVEVWWSERSEKN